MLKRVLSILLSLVMVISMMPLQVFAEDATEPAEQIIETEPVEETTAPTETVTEPPEEITAPTETVTEPPEETTAPTEAVTEPPEKTTAPTEAVTEPPEETTAPTEAVQPDDMDDTTAPTEEVVSGTGSSSKDAADATASGYPEIAEGVATSVSLGEKKSKYFSFIPKYTESYTFYSTGAYDSYGYLYDSNEVLITSNDDGGSGMNFSITYTLQANVEYILRAKNIDEDYDTFSVSIKANHTGNKTVTKEATCLQSGIISYVCDNCGRTIEESIPMLDHDYVNGVCQLCGGDHEIIGNGTCGNSMYWTMYDSGLLKITGTGEMYSWASSSNVPWYSYRDQITALTVENGITSIGGYALYMCANLKSAALPDSITSIGNWAFSDCTELNEITIPGNLTHIQDGAFTDCSKLTNVELPETLEYIGQSAFSGTALVRVSIPANVHNICDYAFARCMSLVEITVSSSNTNYKSYNGILFNPDLTRLYQYPNGKANGAYSIPEGVEDIWTGAFYDCTGLTQINFPESLRYIGPSAFSGCTGLTALELPSEVWKIDEWAFMGCKLDYIQFYPGLWQFVSYAFSNASVGAVYYGGTVQDWANITFETSQYGTANNVIKNNSNIYYQAFGSCGENVEYKIRDKVLIISGTGPMKDYSSSAASNTAAEIPWYCNKQNINGIVVEDGVTSIGDYAFYNLNYVASVSIGKDVKVIGKNAFFYCNENGLSGIILPDGLTTIRDNAFWGCTKLTSMTIPASVTSVGKSAFQYCDRLASITFLGNFPNMAADGNQFYNLPALQVYYPANNVTWSENVRLTYGSNKSVTWVASCGEHVFNEDDIMYIWTDTYSSCTAVWACANEDCQVEKAKQSVTAVAKVTNPTCTADGIANYTATFTVAGFEKQSVTKKLPATGHTEVIDEAVAPTCTEDGLTEGKHCSACDKVILKQEVIPAGHTVENGICTTCGVYGTCGENLTWEYDAIANILTISGSGAMEDYNNQNEFYPPWKQFNKEIKKVVVGEGVTTVGILAFSGCSALVDVSLPEGLTALGSSSLNSCSSLTSVKIPSTVISIGSDAFAGSGLTGISLPEGLTEISDYCFYFCKSLETITVPENVSYIGGWAFVDCDSLVSITLPASLKEIETSAFDYTPALTDVYYNGTVEQWKNITIGEYNNYLLVGTNIYFNGMPGGTCGENLTWGFDDATGTLTISGSGDMDHYEDSEFSSAPWHEYSDKITTLIVEDGVTGIGNYAFYKFNELTSVTLADSVKTIGVNSFFGCNFSELILPASLESIGFLTFASCTKLQEVTLPSNVTEIEPYAFAACYAMSKVTVEADSVHLGYNVFEQSGVSQIVFEGDAPSFDDYTFYAVTATAYYPANNPTWTSDVMQNYGGTITWVPVVKEPEKFDLTGITATFGDSLAMNFVINTANLEGSDNYAVITKNYADGRVVEVTMEQSDWKVYSGSLYYFSFNGIAAKEMMDSITAVVYNGNGQQVTNDYVTSLQDYCLRAWNKEAEKASPDTDKLTQYIDMLNYGAAAQVKFGYDTGNLANASLTAAQKAYATPDSAVTLDDVYVKGTGCAGITLTLVSQIELNFVFENSTIDQAAYAIATFTDHYGKAKEVRIETFPVYSSTRKYVPVTGMSAADCGQTVTLNLYDSEGNVLSTCVESVTSMCSRATSSNALYWACIKYCQASYKYFH